VTTTHRDNLFSIAPPSRSICSSTKWPPSLLLHASFFLNHPAAGPPSLLLSSSDGFMFRTHNLLEGTHNYQQSRTNVHHHTLTWNLHPCCRKTTILALITTCNSHATPLRLASSSRATTFASSHCHWRCAMLDPSGQRHHELAYATTVVLHHHHNSTSSASRSRCYHRLHLVIYVAQLTSLPIAIKSNLWSTAMTTTIITAIHTSQRLQRNNSNRDAKCVLHRRTNGSNRNLWNAPCDNPHGSQTLIGEKVFWLERETALTRGSLSLDNQRVNTGQPIKFGQERSTFLK